MCTKFVVASGVRDAGLWLEGCKFSILEWKFKTGWGGWKSSFLLNNPWGALLKGKPLSYNHSGETAQRSSDSLYWACLFLILTLPTMPEFCQKLWQYLAAVVSNQQLWGPKQCRLLMIFMGLAFHIISKMTLLKKKQWLEWPPQQSMPHVSTVF